jgi:hypothetical protein
MSSFAPQLLRAGATGNEIRRGAMTYFDLPLQEGGVVPFVGEDLGDFLGVLAQDLVLEVWLVGVEVLKVEKVDKSQSPTLPRRRVRGGLTIVAEDVGVEKLTADTSQSLALPRRGVRGGLAIAVDGDTE